MLYEELHRRYGNHVAKRIQRGLNHIEFNSVTLDVLPTYLEKRAEKAAKEYKTLMDNPLDRGNVRCEILQTSWREAEDLAYLLAIAEDVSMTVRTAMVVG